MKKRKNVEQEYLNPHEDSRVFDDNTLVSYSVDRRAWVVCKDGFELILRDTLLPQPEEVIAHLEEREEEHVSHSRKNSRHVRDANAVLAQVFPGRSMKFYQRVRVFLAEALIGVVETPRGPMPAYDLAHLRALLDDVEPSRRKTCAMMGALVSGFSAHDAAFFVTIPPTKFDDEEEEPDGPTAL